MSKDKDPNIAEGELASEETLNKEDLLAQVKAAAEAGAKAGARHARPKAPMNPMTVIRCLVAALIVVAIVAVFFGVKNFLNQKPFESMGSSDDHDLVVDDPLIGYTAADFADAFITSTHAAKSLEVYTVKVVDVVTVTESGLGNWAIFSKTQYVTYTGTGIYTVDLSNFGPMSIDVDNKAKVVTVRFPHAKLTTLSIPASEMEYGDVERGLLAFGDLKMTPEAQAAIEQEAEAKMRNRLIEDRAADNADRFATMALWEIFQPLVTKMAPGYLVKVELR